MKKLMNLNKETAFRLWVQQFGRGQKAIDFSGREIAKAAYNDRNSNYGWNVDHILPLSRGGKTADHNLVCCHILTNDEKADKFPCFKANEKEFEIQKKQNHYEIIQRTAGQEAEEDETINFWDAAQGLECWEQCKSDGRGVFAGYVKIRVEISNKSNQLLDRYLNFLMELFGVESIFAEESSAGYISVFSQPYNRVYVFTVIVGTVPTKEDTQNFLDNCVLLNTYNTYFTNSTGFENIQIVCGMKDYNSRFEMSMNCKKDFMEKRVWFNAPLAIDELVKINTDAEKELKNFHIPGQDGFYPYDYTFKELKRNLGKYI